MLLLGGAVLFLTMALVEANPFGGDLPLWLSLMQGGDPARRRCSSGGSGARPTR